VREQLSVQNAPLPGGAYSQGIVARGFLYTAGVGPHDPRTGNIVGTTIEVQTEQAMRNLGAILASRNLDFPDVVKTTVHLADLKRDFVGFNESYARFVVHPYPARTTVGSTLAGILVEIDLVAVLPY